MIVFADGNPPTLQSSGQAEYSCSVCKVTWLGRPVHFMDGRMMLVGAFYCSPTCVSKGTGLPMPPPELDAFETHIESCSRCKELASSVPPAICGLAMKLYRLVGEAVKRDAGESRA